MSAISYALPTGGVGYKKEGKEKFKEERGGEEFLLPCPPPPPLPQPWVELGEENG